MVTTTPLIKTTPHAHRMSYRIGRGEQGVLTFEPYKSSPLPLWRFRTAAVARRGAADLWARFERFGRDDEADFVGMDMARKFLQMGMTRAKRYANHAGGRKYRKGKGAAELPRTTDESQMSPDQREKAAASLVFWEAWERCRAHEGYQRRKAEFLAEQKEWEKQQAKS
ncbi:hypothetical protein PG994_012019 [Apiospora phragmitis]|uniref:DUF4385 domain-containing protein n=1 Tax=Apiospora phragmitis TaxID=2905665 RepID=A0ABR1TUF4_9PEZI